MGRRRKNNDEDLVVGIAQLVGFVFLLAFLFPSFRQSLAILGTLLKLVIGIAVLILIAWIVIRYLIRSKKRIQFAATDYSAPVHVTVAEPVRLPPTDNLGDQLRKIDWFQFERVIAIIYSRKGYNVTKKGGANPDGGIDLILEKNGVRTAIQCKQWKTWNVGVKGIREFLGALTDAGIQKGIFVTLRGYSGDAKHLAEKHGIEILNEPGLIQLLEETHAQYDPDLIEALNDERKLCPKCEDQLVIRTAKRGVGMGRQFRGCKSYPRCQFTMPR